MLKRLLHFVFGPHTFEVVAIALAAFGVAFGLAAEKDDIVKAHYFFAAAALLSLGRVVHLLLTWKGEQHGGRYIAAFLMFGVVAVSWLAAFDWVQGKLDRMSTTSAGVDATKVNDSHPSETPPVQVIDSNKEKKRPKTTTKPHLERSSPESAPTLPVFMSDRPTAPEPPVGVKIEGHHVNFHNNYIGSSQLDITPSATDVDAGNNTIEMQGWTSYVYGLKNSTKYADWQEYLATGIQVTHERCVKAWASYPSEIREANMIELESVEKNLRHASQQGLDQYLKLLDDLDKHPPLFTTKWSPNGQ